ncbi:AraC family transcriptional regulator [Nonomuraea lactucae]|uniref:AraC family transcriptional regulator n=1 Tax=Nonomuraea lactucae TaxID=2249762 RepID=UPI000DE2D1EE|nr:AraC family transcriptional regulator [Nonomuraea lactucae]
MGPSRPPGQTSEPAGPAPLIAGGDIEVMRELVTRSFAPHRLQIIRSHPAGGRYAIRHQGDISLHALAYGAEIRVLPQELPGFHNIHIPLSGGGSLTVDGREVTSRLTVIGPRQHLDMHWSADNDTLIANIPSALVEGALAELLGDSPRTPLRFEPAIGDSTAISQALVAIAAAAAAPGPFPFAASALAEHHFEQFVLHTLLTSQPHNHSAAMSAPTAPATPASLRRARSYCHDHAAEAVTLGDIAAAARMSVRTLQQSFREHLQTTPMAYLRSVRLEHAHRDLLHIAATGGHTTVTEVALRWGFTHLGRFATLYKATYGQSPSQTLRAHDAT